jgi:hypothetical protein
MFILSAFKINHHIIPAHDKTMKVNEEKQKKNEQTKLTFCDKSKSIPFGKI